jgi:hypothetical protein
MGKWLKRWKKFAIVLTMCQAICGAALFSAQTAIGASPTIENIDEQYTSCILEKFRETIFPPQSPELEQLLAELKIDFRDIPHSDSASAARWNANVLQSIADIPLPNKPNRASAIDQEQASRLLDAVKNHPVASLSVIKKYDPDDRLGFCFGRAMAVHLEANALGIDQNSVRKLFAVGNLSDGKGGNWNYHITTIIRASDGDWWAIDPIMDHVMKVRDWYEIVRDQLDNGKNMQIYSTPPTRFARGVGKYQKVDPYYFINIYLRDLIKSFKERDQVPFSGQRLIPLPKR